MTRRVPVLLGVLASALVLSPSAGSAALPKAPVITSISPKKLNVGDTLTIRGPQLPAGQLPQHRGLPEAAGPGRLPQGRQGDEDDDQDQAHEQADALPQPAGRDGAARRASASASWPSASAPPSRPSPCPRRSAPARVPPPATAPTATTTGPRTRTETDDDNDLLSDTTEAKYRLDSCNPDTDGDGIEDGWEYYSALDLNSRAVPYPAKRPYPNPLDKGDATIDHDGDSLEEFQEYAAWVRYGGHRLGAGQRPALQRRHPEQRRRPQAGAGRPAVARPRRRRLAVRRRARRRRRRPQQLRRVRPRADDSRVVDRRSSSRSGPTTTPYPGVDWLDNDSDGDGVADGDDDQDHDDVNNVQETVGQRALKPSLYGIRSRDIWIQPYNPCLPNYRSRTCAKHPPSAGQVVPAVRRQDSDPAADPPLRRRHGAAAALADRLVARTGPPSRFTERPPTRRAFLVEEALRYTTYTT